MVKRLLSLMVCLVLSVTLCAATTIKGGGTFAGSFLWQEETSVRTYTAEPYLEALFSSSNLKGDVKLSALAATSPSGSTLTGSLDRAFFKFRVPTFADTNLTVTVGKAPVSWGIGAFYRVGDVLFDQPFSNKEIGTDVENTLWVLSLSQPLGGGFTLDGAFVPTEEKGGLLLRKDFRTPVVKEIKSAVAVDRDGKVKASVCADLSLYFDVTLGIESSFTEGNEYRVVANAMRMFTFQGNAGDITGTLYVSGQMDGKANTADLLLAWITELDPRVTLTTAIDASFTDDGDSQYVLAGVDVALADGVDLTTQAYLMRQSTESQLGSVLQTALKLAF
jgi:hypothetical protein